MHFDEFGLNEQLLEGISYMGFKEATPIQEQAIPVILQGKDLLASAQTGTGKTAAFLLPILHMLAKDHEPETNMLIIVPTRELALQIDQQIQALGYFVPVQSVPVYGGGNPDEWVSQKNALARGVDIVVATPGKLLGHLNLGLVKLDKVEHLVLDEADRMLDMGFIDDIKRIISHTPESRQTMMFSATMPPEIRKLAKTIMKDPEEITLKLSKPAENVLQAAYIVYDEQKIPLINHLLAQKTSYQSILIFTSTKKMVGEIVKSLKRHDFAAEGISSDYEQKEREDVLNRFRARRTRILVATDVLSRGIDIKDIDLVINFDVPQDAEDYVHRIGRTARAKASGVALTFVSTKDMGRFKRIEKLIERDVMKLPLPADIGEGPDPNSRSRSGGRSGKGGERSGRNYSKGRNR